VHDVRNVQQVLGVANALSLQVDVQEIHKSLGEGNS